MKSVHSGRISCDVCLFRYAKLLQQYAKEKRERKRSESKRRSSTRLSESKS